MANVTVNIPETWSSWGPNIRFNRNSEKQGVMGHSGPDLGPWNKLPSDLGGKKRVNLYDTNPMHKITRGNPSKLPTTFEKSSFIPTFNGIPLKQWSFQKLTNSRISSHVCTTFGSEPLRGCRNQQNQGTKSANAYGNNFGSATVLTLDIVACLRIVFVFRFPCGCSLVV